jgi:hypothetical protein
MAGHLQQLTINSFGANPLEASSLMGNFGDLIMANMVLVSGLFGISECPADKWRCG